MCQPWEAYQMTKGMPLLNWRQSKSQKAAMQITTSYFPVCRVQYWSKSRTVLLCYTTPKRKVRTRIFSLSLQWTQNNTLYRPCLGDPNLQCVQGHSGAFTHAPAPQDQWRELLWNHRMSHDGKNDNHLIIWASCKQICSFQHKLSSGILD